MYMDRLDGRISALSSTQVGAVAAGAEEIEQRIQKLKSTEMMPAASVEIVRSVSSACDAFDAATAEQQRALATALLQNATGRPAVRVNAKIAVRRIGALELRKSKYGKRKPGSGRN